MYARVEEHMLRAPVKYARLNYFPGVLRARVLKE